jgi:DNA-binding beta-propeller fold protein YncE
MRVALIATLGFALIPSSPAGFKEGQQFSGQRQQPELQPGQVNEPMHGRFIYAALDDGSIHVYAIDDSHREVKTITTVSGVHDCRGVCASAETGMFYLAHQNETGGHVVAVNLYTDEVVWERSFQPGADRLSCTPDGQKLYVPSNEAFTADILFVVDALSGDELTRIQVTPRPHDCLNSLSGDRVYIETKSSNYIDVIDTSTDEIISQIGPFADIGGPYTINGNQTRLYGNFYGVNGFQEADLTTGAVLYTIEIEGQGHVDGQLNQHGIGLTPDERELWVTDGVGNQPLMHVFDVTTDPPTPLRDVTISYTGPHWITFTINGDYAYPAGPKGQGHNTDVIDTSTYQRVGSIGPSEDLLEVDFDSGVISQVGNQFGVGRVTGGR